MFKPGRFMCLNQVDHVFKGRSAEFFKTSVLCARRKLIPRLSFQPVSSIEGHTDERLTVA